MISIYFLRKIHVKVQNLTIDNYVSCILPQRRNHRIIWRISNGFLGALGYPKYHADNSRSFPNSTDNNEEDFLAIIGSIDQVRKLDGKRWLWRLKLDAKKGPTKQRWKRIQKGVYETEKYEKQCFALLNQKVPRVKKETWAQSYITFRRLFRRTTPLNWLSKSPSNKPLKVL